MNILIAATHLKQSNGGVCTHIIDLCRSLCKTEKVVLVAHETDYAQQLKEIEGLTYIEIPFSEMDQSKKAIWKCFVELRKVCKAHHIQLMHLHGQRLIPIAWMVRITTGVPFLWTNHIDAIPQQDLMRKMWKMMRFPIISVSTELKKQLVDELGMDPSKITVVNNGVDIASLEPLSNEEKENLRRRFGIKPDTYVIAEVARLTPVKGQHLLVRAVHALNQKNLGVKLQVLLAGSGDMQWFQRQVLDYAEKNGVDCNYLGFCKPREVYGVADLAVLSSCYEGFSISSVEAMSMHCPVLRSNTPGCADMEGLVLVCKKDDLADLTAKMEYAIIHRTEMNEMVARAHSVVGQRFTKETMTAQTMAVYRRILGE